MIRPLIVNPMKVTHHLNGLTYVVLGKLIVVHKINMIKAKQKGSAH